MKSWLKRRLHGTWLHRSIRFVKIILARLPRLDDRNSAYDRETIEVLKRVLRRRSSAIDVGAHRGSILQHMMEFAPEGWHHAFEALPHLANYLKQKFPRVCVHEAAVSDRIGRAEFLHVENDPGYSGLRRRNYDRPDPLITAITVSTTTIDDSIPANLPIEFIKLDIEGGEYHALRGAQATIARCRPTIVFEASCHSTGQYGVTPGDLYSFLTDTLGYRVTTMRRWLDGKPAYTLDEFIDNWTSGPDYYFLAEPV
jgi:FkbM family methyltransferase